MAISLLVINGKSETKINIKKTQSFYRIENVEIDVATMAATIVVEEEEERKNNNNSNQKPKSK